MAEQVEEREVDRVIRARAGVGLPPGLFELAIQVEVVLDLVTTVLGARMTVFRVYQILKIDAPVRLLIGRGKLLPEGHKFDYLKPSDAFTLKPAVKAKADKSLPPPLN